MDAIYIPQIAKAPEQTETAQISDYLPGLDTLTPVSGHVRVTHRGNYLEVNGQAEAIVTLTCDRCLQQYNHRLAVDASELIWLGESGDDVEKSNLVEREVALEDLVETLPPNGYFYPTEWLYEQLCLEIPQRQLCDASCAGIQPGPAQSDAITDRRWASLEALRSNLLN